VPDHQPIDVVAAPDAPLGRADATRRWALRFPDGRVRFPGVIRPDAAAAVDVLSAMAPDLWDAALVRVELEVVLSDGAGPYLVAPDGTLVLVLGTHPEIRDLAIAMGQPDGTRHLVGLVRELAGGVWGWWTSAGVPSSARVAALDALVELASADEVDGWARRFGGSCPTAGLQ
jgi:hypothetical protein